MAPASDDRARSRPPRSGSAGSRAGPTARPRPRPGPTAVGSGQARGAAPMRHRPIKPLVLNEDEIRRAAPSRREIVAIVEDTYRMDAAGEAEVPSKIGVHPDRANSLVHAMPAWVSGASALGVKLISYYPGNSAQGLHDSTGIIVLYNPADGQPLAIMEGMWITFARTAACAAVAAKCLARPEPRRLGLVGCGGLGEWSLLTLTEVFPSLREIRVASRRVETREAFCARFAGKGPWRVEPAAEP